MVTNYFKCAPGLWRKFTDHQRLIFNYVYEKTINNQDLITHPLTPYLADEEWTTICYNMACYAAWALENERIVIKQEIVEREEKLNTGRIEEWKKEDEEFIIDSHFPL